MPAARCSKRGNSRVSRELLEKAAAADPSAGLELPLAIAAFHSAGAEEGLKHLERVPESARNADYYLARAQMLDAAGKSADALASLDRALRAAPDRADIYWQEVVFLKKDGRTDDALELLDRAGKSAAAAALVSGSSRRIARKRRSDGAGAGSCSRTRGGVGRKSPPSGSRKG